MRSVTTIAILAALFLATSSMSATAGGGNGRPPLHCKLKPNGQRDCGASRTSGGGDTPENHQNTGTPEQQDQCFLDCTGHNPYHSQQVSDTCKTSCYGGSH